MPRKLDLAAAFASFDETWSPRLAARVDDYDVRLVKLEGEFVWHSHEREDELFLVVAGRLLLRFRDHEEELGPGELIVVPRGIEHLPVALEPTQVVLFERSSVVNTGSAGGERTRAARPLG